MKTTAGDKKRKSRFLINDIIGKYPPWRGYDATDLLNADNYLLFSFLLPQDRSISLQDLHMRSYLFAQLGETTLPVLALEKNGKEIIFLLRKYRLAGLKDFLSGKQNGQLKNILAKITGTVISGWNRGLYFNNIAPEAVVVIDERPVILPTAYLIPGTILSEIEEDSGKVNDSCPRMIRDIRSLGNLFSLFQTFFTGEDSRLCADITGRLSDTGCELNPGELFETLDMMRSFLDLEEITATATTRENFLVRPSGGIAGRISSKLKSFEDGGLLLLKGEEGNGRSSLLRIVRERILPELGLTGSSPGQDEVFSMDQNGDSSGKQESDCILIDDHIQDPFLCCHFSNLIFDYARKGRAVVCVVSDSTPEYFTGPLEEDFRRHSIPVETLEIPSLDQSSRKKLFQNRLPTDRISEPLKQVDISEKMVWINYNLNLVLLDPDRNEPATGHREVLEDIGSMEKSILTFMAVFKFDIPLNILKKVYSTYESRFYRALQHLMNLGLVIERAGVSKLSGGDLCQLFSLSSVTLAKEIRGSVSPERRKQLNSNIVFILENISGIPPCYKNYHLHHSGEKEGAAASYYKNFRKFLGRGSSSSISCMFSSFIEARLYKHLPMEMYSKLLVEAGDHFSFAGQFDEARKYYKQCREYISANSQEEKLRSLYVEAIRKECDILERRGNFQKAEKILKKTIEEYSSQCTLKERSKLFNDLAWVYYRMGQFDRSWQNCIKVQKLVDKKELYSELAQSYNLMGTINWNRSKYEEAIFCHSKCLNLREQSNDRAGIASSFNNLGLVYRSSGKFAEAIDCFSKSMKIKQKINNIPGLAAAYLNLSLVYLDREDYDRALENSGIACSYAEKTGNQELLAQAYGTIGEINYYRKDYQKAQEYYKKALDICRRTKSTREEAIVLRRMSQLNLSTGQRSVAENFLQQARKYNERIGSHLEAALLNEVEGELLIKNGDRESGISKLEGAALELSLLGRKNRAAIINIKLGELYLEAGNEPFSREYLIRSISLAGDNRSVVERIRNLESDLNNLSDYDLSEKTGDKENYRILCRTISLLRTINEPQKLYDRIIETALQFTGMERGLIAVRNSPQDYYTVLASSGEYQSGDKLSYDDDIVSIINIVNQMGYPLDTTRISLPLDKVSDSFLGKHPRILCLPLKLKGGLNGSLYLDSGKIESERDQKNKELLLAILQQLATSLEKALIERTVISSATPISPPQAGKTAGVRKFDHIVSESTAMSMVCDLIDGVKEMDTTVILTGESGTGKDLTAKTIHHSSSRKDFKFQAVNVSALPKDLLESELFGHEKGSFTGAYRQKKGHFETAGKGTIFLNEIGDLPLSLQPKLLQVLEERTFFRVGGTEEIITEARIITATNKDLQKLVKKGEFREDLYYRINIFPINIPPLRKRKEDIAPLCEHFLKMYCRLYNYPLKKISPEAMIYLQKYSWPGNIRQLESTIIRLIIVSGDDIINTSDLPEEIIRYSDEYRVEETSSFQETIQSLVDNIDFASSSPILPKVERSVIRKVVDMVGDKTKAASILGISKPTLYKRLKKDEE
ncbi:MAG: tetratricopeptide repeat protein [Candidatus Latescibacteria bacterium]|nr:tetratricopeptide repeat protein [bacterium]MBD3425461.1 tetratricopeptide repeat protein [Candidatus Latescibacterota bacterium]